MLILCNSFLTQKPDSVQGKGYLNLLHELDEVHKQEVVAHIGNLSLAEHWKAWKDVLSTVFAKRLLYINRSHVDHCGELHRSSVETLERDKIVGFMSCMYQRIPLFPHSTSAGKDPLPFSMNSIRVAKLGLDSLLNSSKDLTVYASDMNKALHLKMFEKAKEEKGRKFEMFFPGNELSVQVLPNYRIAALPGVFHLH